MKVRYKERRLSPGQLQEEIHKEAEKYTIDLCKKVARQQTIETVATMFYIKHLQGWKKQQIQKYFDDIVILYNTPSVFGKTIKGNELVDFIAKKYDLDFSRLQPKFEVEDE